MRGGPKARSRTRQEQRHPAVAALSVNQEHSSHLHEHPLDHVIPTLDPFNQPPHLSPRPTRRFNALGFSFGFGKGGTGSRASAVAVKSRGDEQAFDTCDDDFDHLEQEAYKTHASENEYEQGELKLNEIQDFSKTPKPLVTPEDDAFVIKFPARTYPPSLARPLPLPSNLPVYQHLPAPRPYNPDYPHPIGIYASAHVNPAAVRVSGFDSLLEQVSKEDPRVLAAAQIDPAILVPLKVLEKEGNENSSPAILALLHDAARRADAYMRGQGHQQLAPRFRPQPPSPPRLQHSSPAISLVSLASVSEHSVDSAPPPTTPHHVPRRRESMPVFVGGRVPDRMHRRVSMPVIKRVGALRLEQAIENPSQSSPSPETHVVPLSPASKYKTEACQSFWIHGSCTYGRYCVFLHSDLDPVGGIPGVTRLLDAGLPLIEQERINAQVYDFMHASQLDLAAYSPPSPGQINLPPENIIARRASSDMLLSGIARQNEIRRLRAAGPCQPSMNRSCSLSNLAEHTIFDPFATSPSCTPQPLPTEPCTTDQDSVIFARSRHTRSNTCASSSTSSSGKAADGSWDYTAPTSIWR